MLLAGAAAEAIFFTITLATTPTTSTWPTAAAWPAVTTTGSSPSWSRADVGCV